MTPGAGSPAKQEEDACWREAARLRAEHRCWIVVWLAADAMRAQLASPGLEQGSGGRPAHRYSLADFGLTADQVAERFARPRG